VQGSVKKCSVAQSSQIKSENCSSYVREDILEENNIDVRVHKTPFHSVA
jgi:hypothetical protein